ncbi:nucleotide exchange factor GrpE [Mycolicibacterium mengxianglii]|uniref:nucleotide exchange factor GrpE n=1 Tax=Mycolicibacterium mengxianglii TaxID=2736649 RepID=UPI0018D07611|nr:nucleotide exchange factor GrpE [Mycolicibacterium mengxianglii]
MSQSDPQEPVTVTDKRRIDPTTGEVREPTSGAAPSGPSPEAAPTPAAAPDDAEVADLKATLQRVKAEYDNYRKRAIRQEQAAADRAKATVVSQFLPILDDLDRARSHGDLETGPLKSVADKLATALDGVGLAAFGAEGDPFDPSLHEAVQHEGDGSNPVIGTVMRQGYRLGEQVLRHALVGVVDAPEGAAADSNPETGKNSATTADEATES